MALHAFSVFDKVYKWSPEKIALEKHQVLQRSENRQVTGFIILMSPMDCCVRINHKSDGSFNGDLQS